MHKMIIVDDESITRLGIRTSIDWASIGIEIVGEAHNGEKGLQVAQEERPDIIITDIRMPIVDGLQMIERLNENSIKAKMIVISAYEDFSYAREAMKLGVRDYLVKPVCADDLITTVTRMCNEITDNSDQYKPQNFVTKSGKNQHIINSAVEYINKNFNSAISLTEIAEHVYISPNYFCSIFKSETGYSFVEWLNKTRVEKSTAMLSDNRYRIYEIAKMVGFRDQKYYASIFFKHFGMSPSEYRSRSSRI